MRPRAGDQASEMRGPTLLRSSGMTELAPVIGEPMELRITIERGVRVLRRRQERVIVARADGERERVRKAKGVFRKARELVRDELRRRCAEALRIAAEAEVVNRGVDAGAGAVRVRMNVEGVVGDPVDETAVTAVCRSAVVEKRPGGVRLTSDHVGDAAPVRADAEEIAAVRDREGVGELETAFIRICGTADA